MYYGIVFALLGGFTLVLALLRVDAIFYWTFFLFGSIYMSVSVWEALNEAWLGMTHIYWVGGIAHFYWFSLWWVTIAIASVSFFIMYVVYQVHISKRLVWDKTIALLGLVGGCAMVFGVAEDFGVFTMWGFEHFNLTDAPWHQSYFMGLFPTFYFWLIPGVILVATSLIWSTLNRGTKQTMMGTAILRSIKTTCPLTEKMQLCTVQGEFLGVRSQICVMENFKLCIKNNE